MAGDQRVDTRRSQIWQWASPGFKDKSVRVTPWHSADCPWISTNPHRTPTPVYGAAKGCEAVELCLQENLSCNTVAERLGVPSSSLARWVRQAGI